MNKIKLILFIICGAVLLVTAIRGKYDIILVASNILIILVIIGAVLFLPSKEE
jgi:hypothetical protein